MTRHSFGSRFSAAIDSQRHSNRTRFNSSRDVASGRISNPDGPWSRRSHSGSDGWQDRKGRRSFGPTRNAPRSLSSARTTAQCASF
ncbi:hypothetical protein U0070_017520 [Myodes glareolus]|uniref:Uncharacterized protein n=1 Tax=Myodes glareolus TaxID=447135 RepID=A0AAW0H2A3_MYOGA